SPATPKTWPRWSGSCATPWCSPSTTAATRAYGAASCTTSSATPATTPCSPPAANPSPTTPNPPHRTRPQGETMIVNSFGHIAPAFSGGRRNALVVGEESSELLAGGVVAEPLAGAVVELVGDVLELGGGPDAEVGALGEVL